MGNFIAIAAACILALAGHRVAGRLVGLSITGLCSASMAYFLMPPVFSLRVSQADDLVALAFYGGFGLVLARSASSKRKPALVRQELVRNTPPPKPKLADITLAVPELMASDLGVQLHVADIAVDVAPAALPCTDGDAVRILSDIVTAALRGPEVRRVSIYGGSRPGLHRLVISAHRVWPPPLGRVITIGKRDEDCEPAVFPGWPPHIRVSWFDNGYDRIYQLSAETSTKSTPFSDSTATASPMQETGPATTGCSGSVQS